VKSAPLRMTKATRFEIGARTSSSPMPSIATMDGIELCRQMQRVAGSNRHKPYSSRYQT